MIAQFLIAAFAVLAASSVSAQTAQEESAPQSRVKATYGDWQVKCTEVAEEVCLMTQVGANDSGNPIIEMLVRRTPGLEDDQGRAVPAAMQIAAPHGVLLTSGLTISIDGGQELVAPFKYCDQRACFVQEPVANDYISAMKGGLTATLKLTTIQQETMTIPISLNGFTDAYDNL